jgi:transcriptional regulator with XRE-family HTH domain
VVRAAFDEVIEVPDDLGWSLLKQETNWQFANHPPAEPLDQPEPIEQVSPGELVRRSLKSARSQQGLTQEQLAERASEAGYPLTKDRLSELETGRSKRGPTVDELVALAYALNLSPNRLLQGAFLPDRVDVAVTATVTTTLWGYHAWLQGMAPLQNDRRSYMHAISDRDHLDRQQLTVQLLAQSVEALIDAAHDYRNQPTPDHERELNAAIEAADTRLRALEHSHDNLPSRRPRRHEHRGRPRNHPAR